MKLFKISQEKIKKLTEYLSESPEAKFALDPAGSGIGAVVVLGARR